MTSKVLALLDYRDFIIGSVKRDFQLRYMNSIFGAAWAVVNPIAMIAVYAIVFSQLMPVKFGKSESGFQYSFYLCSGILAWGLFVEITTRCQSMFLENSTLVKKIKFPLICIPIAITLSSLINFIIIFFLFMLFTLIFGHLPSRIFFFIIPILALLIMFSLGLGLILSILNVFFRDVGHLFGLIITFWFWMTPIVYPLSALSPSVQFIIKLNPITPIIVCLQDIIVFKQVPDLNSLFYPACLTMMMLWVGAKLIKARMNEMVDEL